MEKKSNGGLIAIIIVLVIALLWLSFYVAYDKGLIFSNEKEVEETETDDKEVQEDNLVEQSIPNDMELVSSKLNELGINDAIEWYYNDLSNGVNLLDDSNRKLRLLNLYFMKNGLVTMTNFGSEGMQDFPYVSLDTYKAKYAEVYGSLDNFELDTINASGPIFYIADEYDSTLVGNVGFNGTGGVSEYELELEAKKVVYDEASNSYVIEGNILADVFDNNVGAWVEYPAGRGTFKVVYVNDGNTKYITSITIAS